MKDKKWKCHICGHDSKGNVCVSCSKNQTTVKGFTKEENIKKK